jgi:hypothetical protein
MPRIDLDVPFNEKDDAKRLGAWFDRDAKRWYVPEGKDPAPFARWRSESRSAPAAFQPATIARKAPVGPRLTIEMVPESVWFSNVRDHVSGSTWKKIQQATFAAAGHRCEVCGGVGHRHPVECHEIWHYDDAKSHQTLVGMQALCPRCHEVKHMGLANVRGRGAIAEAHLARINGWDRATAHNYAMDASRKCYARGRVEWTLDLSFLKTKFGIEVAEKRPRIDETPDSGASAGPRP